MTFPRTGPRFVVKVGGSHAADRVRIATIVRELSASPIRSVVVPGGGFFADAVREAQRTMGFSDKLAHRLAIEAMCSFAAVLAELYPQLVMAVTRQEIDAAHAAGRIPVWRPDRLISGVADIPENWTMTSDSFAAWLAFELDAAGLVIVKSLDGPAESAAVDLTAAGITDDAFPAFAGRLSCPVRLVGPASLPRLGDVLASPDARIGTVVSTAYTERGTDR